MQILQEWECFHCRVPTARHCSPRNHSAFNASWFLNLLLPQCCTCISNAILTCCGGTKPAEILHHRTHLNPRRLKTLFNLCRPHPPRAPAVAPTAGSSASWIWRWEAPERPGWPHQTRSWGPAVKDREGEEQKGWYWWDDVPSLHAKGLNIKITAGPAAFCTKGISFITDSSRPLLVCILWSWSLYELYTMWSISCMICVPVLLMTCFLFFFPPSSYFVRFFFLICCQRQPA